MSATAWEKFEAANPAAAEHVAVYEHVMPVTPRRAAIWGALMRNRYPTYRPDLIGRYCLYLGRFPPSNKQRVFFGPCNAAGEKESWFTAEHLGLTILGAS